jgi:uncharacterized SAM-binding protein YcdF (DUF218 family)
MRERPEIQEVPRALIGRDPPLPRTAGRLDPAGEVARSFQGDLVRLGLACAVGAVAVAGYATFRIWRQGETDERGRRVDAIVVLGAAHCGSRPSPVFAARLDHAVDLFAEGVAPRVIVTGGKLEGDAFTEAEVARAHLQGRGIPGAAILAETTGRDTAESLTNVAALLKDAGIGAVMLVSDRTHILRTLRIADDLGIEAHGSPTPISPADRDPRARARATLHELGALARYLLFGR